MTLDMPELCLQQGLSFASPTYFKENHFLFHLFTNMGPKVILLFSGKRKCGKDFLTDHLKEQLGSACEVIKISEPIKSHWAKEKKLSLKELLSDGAYKEQYRLELIKWSEEMRDKDYGCFCRTACQNAGDKPVWIVSDIRRKTDIQWFKETYGHVPQWTIRLIADEETRIQRGFIFVAGVDDAVSECNLDDYIDWDLVINNGKDRSPLTDQLSSIMKFVPS